MKKKKQVDRGTTQHLAGQSRQPITMYVCVRFTVLSWSRPVNSYRSFYHCNSTRRQGYLRGCISNDAEDLSWKCDPVKEVERRRESIGRSLGVPASLAVNLEVDTCPLVLNLVEPTQGQTKGGQFRIRGYGSCQQGYITRPISPRLSHTTTLVSFHSSATGSSLDTSRFRHLEGKWTSLNLMMYPC